MRLLCIADTHGKELDLGPVPSCDFIFLLGDLGGSYGWQVCDFLHDHPEYRDRLFSVLGNHDSPYDPVYYPWLNFRKYGQVQVVSDGKRRYSVLFLPFQEEYRPLPLYSAPDIIISHQPPVTYPDMTDFHRGVPYFGRLREEFPDSLWIHGHTHYSGQTGNGRTRSVYGSQVLDVRI